VPRRILSVMFFRVPKPIFYSETISFVKASEEVAVERPTLRLLKAFHFCSGGLSSVVPLLLER